ncbi:unnamed protein product [Ixodes persulcatus]
MQSVSRTGYRRGRCLLLILCRGAQRAAFWIVRFEQQTTDKRACGHARLRWECCGDGRKENATSRAKQNNWRGMWREGHRD